MRRLLSVLLLLLLALPGWGKPHTVGSFKFSTTGAGSGTLVEAYYVDINGPPRINLVLTWDGRHANRAEMDLTPQQVEKLASVLETALASGQDGEYPVASANGRTLIVLNQSADGLHVTDLILKPPGAKGWGDWLVAQINLKPAETEAFRQLVKKMQQQFG